MIEATSPPPPPPPGAIQKKPAKWIWFWKWMKNCWKTKTVMKKKARKRERRKEIANKNKELRWIKKVEKDKLEEKKPSGRLQELNSSFAKIKENKKETKKKKQWKQKRKTFIVIFINCFYCKLFLLINRILILT